MNYNKIELDKNQRSALWISGLFFIFITGSLCLMFFLESKQIIWKLIIILFLGLAWLYVLIASLNFNKFRVFKADFSGEDFKNANISTANFLDLTVIENGEHEFFATTRNFWDKGVFEIHAIFDRNLLYFKTIQNPSKTSVFWPSKTIKKFDNELFMNYKLALEKKDVISLSESRLKEIEEKFWNESELSLSNMLMRISGYAFAFGLGAISIYCIFNLNFIGFFPAIIVLGFIGKYIYWDIKINVLSY